MSATQATGALIRVGSMLRNSRIRRHITQEELAVAVGLSRPTVVAAEAGRSISSQNLFSLLTYLEVPLIERGMVVPIPSAATVPAEATPVQRRRPRIGELMAAERRRRFPGPTSAA